MSADALITSTSDFVDFKKSVASVIDTRFMNWAMYAMIVSYFYNLPVMTYSAIGNNELRLYDFAGLYLMYVFARNYAVVSSYIKLVKIFKTFYTLMQWCAISMIFTTFSSILANKLMWVPQSLLYLFHFWIFFLTAVYFSILIQDIKKLKRFVTFTLVVACLAFIVVMLQNMGLIGFLWNDSYRASYFGFLSGTFGPNKIVLGMSGVFMFAMSMGLMNERRVKLNVALLMVTVGLSALVVVISGSRTSYVGLGVFLAYFSIRETRSFVYSAFMLLLLGVGVSTLKPELLTKALEVYENRVESKISNEEDLKEARVDNLYEDLGAGRKQIFEKYIGMLSEEFYYIPFGRGFNNRIETLSSAHNMYLSLIFELGLVGVVLYVRWLIIYLGIRMPNFPKMQMALQGLVLMALVTLSFGEHLYVYRALFGLSGLFIFTIIVLVSPLFIVADKQ